MAHRNQTGARARNVSRSVGTASLLKEAAPALLDGILPLIGQHYIGRRDPAHSVTPRQQRYLADRGASTKLDHSAFLILERSDRVPYIRLPLGGPRVRIHLPPAGSLQTFDSCVHPLPRLRDPFGYWSYERDRCFESGSLQRHSRCSALHRIEARVLP